MNLNEILVKYGQDHLINALEKANAQDRAKLEKQLSEIDFEELGVLIEQYVKQKPRTEIPRDLSPAPYFPLNTGNPKLLAYYDQAKAQGKKLLASGKVAFLVVAGGQGTRLGFDGPKGTYPICPVSGKSLFGYFAERIKRVSEKYAHRAHWYIMTSELNDAATREFFAGHDYFSLAKEQVHFFTQGTMPAVSRDGRILMNAPDSLALSPNGHGGTLLALKRSGALDEMKREGVEYISYFQVDNPLAPFTDELFLGLHALEGSEMSARMLPKTNAFEKLGNFCICGGKLQIIEYSDMPDDLAQKTNSDGTLAFLAGSPAIHVISRSFVERLTSGGRLNLPWHRADKKVPYLDENMTLVQVDEPNAVKLESFIFDALPLAEKTMILEGCREEHFAPTKNKTGVDSAESCREMMVQRDSRFLALGGIRVPRREDGSADCLVEISPLLACDEEDAAQRLTPDKYKTPEKGEKVYYA